MKKVLSTIVVSAMVFGAASTAFAASSDYYDHLVRTVYNKDQVELTADLGALPTAMDVNLDVATGGFGLGDFSNGTMWADVNLSFFSYDYNSFFDLNTFTNNETTDIWFSSTKNNLAMGDLNLNGTNSFGAATSSVMSLMVGNGTTTVINSGIPNSYQAGFGVAGRMATLLPDASGQLNLADFDAAGDQEAVMYLYHMQKTNADPWTMIDADKAVLTTYEANGGYTVASAPSQVPVPGAIWLLGSGLMGIVGLRRKNS